VDVSDDLRVLVKKPGTSELEERLTLALAALLEVALDALERDLWNAISSSLSHSVRAVRLRLGVEPMLAPSSAATSGCQLGPSLNRCSRATSLVSTAGVSIRLFDSACALPRLPHVALNRFACERSGRFSLSSYQ
jgi:hypothetical protein